MENSNKIIPPHLNAEVYRNDITGTDTVSYLDYIKLHPDGSILLGCSELTGRYWNGGASIFSGLSSNRKLCKEKNNISINSGTADGCFVVHSSRVLLCDDSGAVSIWVSNDDAWHTWNEEFTVAEHDDAVLAVDCLDPGKDYVTVGGDGNVKVWDVNEMICMRSYNAAHSRAIYGVAVRPKSITNFATASLDHFITLWDDNTIKPVIDLVNNDCGVRCLQWLDENVVVFGDEAGVLKLVDIRNTKEIFTVAEFPVALHRLAVQVESQNVALCCDNKTVTIGKVCGKSTYEIINQDKLSHSNYVRGVAWDLNDRNMLYSVGWDGEIKTHYIA